MRRRGFARSESKSHVAWQTAADTSAPADGRHDPNGSGESRARTVRPNHQGDGQIDLAATGRSASRTASVTASVSAAYPCHRAAIRPSSGSAAGRFRRWPRTASSPQEIGRAPGGAQTAGAHAGRWKGSRVSWDSLVPLFAVLAENGHATLAGDGILRAGSCGCAFTSP